MRTAILILAFFLCCGATPARAEFTFACGENREKGAEQAEIAFVNFSDAPMKLLLAGQAADDEKLGVKGLTRNRWALFVDQGAGSVKKYLFTQGAAASLQVSLISEKNVETMLGGKKPCLFEQKKEE
jgi:hypothetical protein